MPGQNHEFRTLSKAKTKSASNWNLKLSPFENCLEAMKEADVDCLLYSKSEPLYHESIVNEFTLKL